MKLNTLYIYIVTTILSLSACSTNSVVEEIPDTPIKPSTESDEPLRFTGATEDMTATTKAFTRSAMLNSGFYVSTYKAFGTKEQQTVMDKYTVAYSEKRDDWNGVVVSNWNYIGTYNGKVQDEKYWDLASYPYRFHAVAPKQSITTPVSLSDLKLTDNELLIPTAFQAQTFEASKANAVSVTPADDVAEPYLVSQVHRDNNGKDFDILKGREEINKTSSTMTRRVAMPFHHLNSKVRFAVYTDNLAQTDKNSYIKDLVISVEKLATTAGKFEAYGTDSWSNPTGFSNFADITISDRFPIFKYNCFEPNETSQKTYESNDLSQHQSKKYAYWLECPDGIMQLPQEDLKIHVSMTIVQSETHNTYFHDYEIKKEEGSDVDPTHWIAGCIHTYYLHLNFDDMMHPIMTVTCTLSDWTDVDGSLSTDLEQ